MKPINLRIAEELGVREQQVTAAISLLDGGATVPFVARYRKEATGALDDAQLRTLEERLRYLRELDERRGAILDSISQQGKLDAALKQAIEVLDRLGGFGRKAERIVWGVAVTKFRRVDAAELRWSLGL